MARLTADIQRVTLLVCPECIVTVSATVRVISTTSGARLLQGATGTVTGGATVGIKNTPKTMSPTFSEELINGVSSAVCQTRAFGTSCFVTSSGYVLPYSLKTSPILGIALGIPLGVFFALYLVTAITGTQKCQERVALQGGKRERKAPTWRAGLTCYMVRNSLSLLRTAQL